MDRKEEYLSIDAKPSLKGFSLDNLRGFNNPFQLQKYVGYMRFKFETLWTIKYGFQKFSVIKIKQTLVYKI